MLRHHHVSADDKVIPLSHGLKGPLEEEPRRCRAEIREPVIATEGDEVKTPAWW